ncbi:hypothetical protein HRbin15_02487 [bacterium HR15]|nr:hypothetical protein HRbin15_02487 [bacterium HR15]
MQWRNVIRWIGFALLVTMVIVSCRQQKPAASKGLSSDEARVMTLLERSSKTGQLTDSEFAEVVQLTQHPDVLVSAKAYVVLWYVKDPKQKERAAELFRKAINHPDAFVRTAVCRGIGYVGSAKDVPLLISRLRDSDPDVRRASLRSLQQLGGPAQREHVRSMLQDPDPEIRQLAQKILQEWDTKSLRR